MATLKTSNRLPDLWRFVGRSLCPFVGTQFVASYCKHPTVVAKVAELLHWFAMHGTCSPVPPVPSALECLLAVPRIRS